MVSYGSRVLSAVTEVCWPMTILRPISSLNEANRCCLLVDLGCHEQETVRDWCAQQDGAVACEAIVHRRRFLRRFWDYGIDYSTATIVNPLSSSCRCVHRQITTPVASAGLESHRESPWQYSAVGSKSGICLSRSTLTVELDIYMTLNSLSLSVSPPSLPLIHSHRRVRYASARRSRLASRCTPPHN